jgi:DNA replication and repair protein RecF
MLLRNLILRNFRCFEQMEASFCPKLNLVIGPNARGKTSLLEGVCVLLRLQSPRAARLGEVIRYGQKGLVADGYFDRLHLQFYYGLSRKKLALDGVEQKDGAEYLAAARVMWFGNGDMELVVGGGDKRRRFLDFVGGQLDGRYRGVLREYERSLRSRNLLLRAPQVRWAEVRAFNEPLVRAGSVLWELRAGLVERLAPLAAEAYRAISGNTEEMMSMLYLAGIGGGVPGHEEWFERSLGDSRDEEARLRTTLVGPHRDDVQLLLSDHPAVQGSEGQQRSVALALRMAAVRVFTEHFGRGPVLLLDDVIGELDAGRRSRLLEMLPMDAQRIVATTSLDWLPGGTGDAQVIRL